MKDKTYEYIVLTISSAIVIICMFIPQINTFARIMVGVINGLNVGFTIARINAITKKDKNNQNDNPI